MVALLAASTVFLSLFIGTRHNPANIAEEFGVLGLAFALWWLTILLARMDVAFGAFVGGRGHLDGLRRLWNVADLPRPFRRVAEK